MRGRGGNIAKCVWTCRGGGPTSGQEHRLYAAPPYYVRFRYDLGTISTLPEEILLAKLHHGVGAELALDTPIGPASFGAGKSFFIRRELQNNPISAGPVLFYFSIGYGM